MSSRDIEGTISAAGLPQSQAAALASFRMELRAANPSLLGYLRAVVGDLARLPMIDPQMALTVAELLMELDAALEDVEGN